MTGDRGLVPVYRRRASALHAARASVAASFCCSLALIAMLSDHPLVLVADLCAIVAVGAAVGVGAEIRRGARLAVPIALLVALINPIVSHQGLTVLVRGWEVLGVRFDVTLEAVAYGVVVGMQVLALIMAFALFSAAVDPDELLQLFRRFSYRSALTASLTTRLAPMLARDALRIGDAARCRPDPPGRLALARAALSGTLDRAVDVAAALEVRGYATARRPAHARAPWSRHDTRVLLSTIVLTAGAIAASAAGLADLVPYPRLELGLGASELLIAGTIVMVALAPFAGARARLGVGRG